MNDPTRLITGLFVPENFEITEVPHAATGVEPATTPLTFAPAPLGPLAAFTGNWKGLGFNTIFRPDNPTTPTTFVPPIASDNVLELNLTHETLSFHTPLGSVPNRGSGAQGDIFLNAVPYAQSVKDVTTLPGNGIHFEPGIWLNVPATTAPNAPITVARMASIPHGTTVVAQGTLIATVAGGPILDPIDITPFAIGNPAAKVRFPSQTAEDATTPRIPQNLASFIAAGTITQDILDDPNTVLRNQVAQQTITNTEVIFISTNPASPLPGGPLPAGAIVPNFGGGTNNIAFLEGAPPPAVSGPNALSFQMDALFWIETVTYQVHVPPLHPGAAPVKLEPVKTHPPVPLTPSFSAAIPHGSKPFAGGIVTVPTTQIQYAQKVLLNFGPLSWPHVSVATLVPHDPIPIPLSLL
jgi:hypothetical protein